MTLGELLDAARTSLVRLDTSRLAQLMSTGEAIVLDTRTPTDRETTAASPVPFTRLLQDHCVGVRTVCVRVIDENCTDGKDECCNPGDE